MTRISVDDDDGDDTTGQTDMCVAVPQVRGDVRTACVGPTYRSFHVKWSVVSHLSGNYQTNVKAAITGT